MKKILFLDFDGVLNHHGSPTKGGLYWVDPVHIKQLNRIVKATGCKIVISSTWRLMHELQELRDILVEQGFEYPSSIIDRTKDLRNESNYVYRGGEVKEWLDRHGEEWSNYAILDDDSDFLLFQVDHFIKTSMEEGLTLYRANDVIAVLNDC
jgi:hypothetical protein